MQKHQLRFGEAGEPSLLVVHVPPELSAGGESKIVFGLPILSREGGLLLAVPAATFDDSALELGQQESELALLGPSFVTGASLVEENESGEVVPVDSFPIEVLIVDVLDSFLEYVKEYDPAGDAGEDICPFDDETPSALPLTSTLVTAAKEWTLSGVQGGRTNFYSAREEQEAVQTPAKQKAAAKKAAPKKITNAILAEQVAALASQVQALSAMQTQAAARDLSYTPSVAPALEAPAGLGQRAFPRMAPLAHSLEAWPGPKAAFVKTAAELVGPPPKTRAAAKATALVEVDEPKDPLDLGNADPMLAALAQQSTAITSLVAHLAGNASDPLADLHTAGPGLGTASTTRGVARRERMQSDLALRQSQYWLAFLQQVSRRMYPSRQVPTSSEMARDSGLSFLAYLERYGAFKQSKELGTILWIVGYIVDAAIAQDFDGVKEHLALFVTALDQAALDQNWDTAFLVSLVEDPPAQIFMERSSNTTLAKPFSPLMPSAWGAVLLAFLKDIDIMSSRKQETKKKTGQASPSTGDPGGEASPKRKPRFPKKPKGGPPNQQQA